MDEFNVIRSICEEELDHNHEIAIYPMGKIGLMAYLLLKDVYGYECIQIDNYKSKYNRRIISIDEFIASNNSNATVVLCVADARLGNVLREKLDQGGVRYRDIQNPYENCVMVRNNQENINYFCEVKKLLKVYHVKGYDMVRIGDEHDGGYVMLNDFEKCGVAYSFGLASNCKWEEDISCRGVKVNCYDHTISEIISDMPSIHFYKKGLTGSKRSDSTLFQLSSLIEENNDVDKMNMILKMDIEGSEWEVIRNLDSELIKRFDQITVELHNLVDHISKKEVIIGALKRIAETHTCIWIHGNNNGQIGECGNIIIPNYIEATFANKESYEFEEIDYSCPTQFDSPNSIYKREIVLKRW